MKKNIKAIIMDVDGTLTDGKIYMATNGELLKAFNIKDGYGIVEARKAGLIPIIITGRSSEIVAQRCKELGIELLYQGISDKLEKLKEVAQLVNLTLEEFAYIGDDLNDLECMRSCGLSACPADAMSDVKEEVNYICQCKGGDGAIRELLDLIMKGKLS